MIHNGKIPYALYKAKTCFRDQQVCTKVSWNGTPSFNLLRAIGHIRQWLDPLAFVDVSEEGNCLFCLREPCFDRWAVGRESIRELFDLLLRSLWPNEYREKYLRRQYASAVWIMSAYFRRWLGLGDHSTAFWQYSLSWMVSRSVAVSAITFLCRYCPMLFKSLWSWHRLCCSILSPAPSSA